MNQKQLFCGSNLSPSGSGTQNDPYLVSFPKNLAWIYRALGNASSKYFAQINNIDLDGIDWIQNYQFTGYYDGGGFEIQNTTINNPLEDYNGFFKDLNGEVSNLTLSNASVTGNNNNGILAYSLTKDLVNVHIVNSSLTGVTENAGISSRASGNINVVNCSVQNISINTTGNNTAAIFGYSHEVAIDKTFATGVINATGNTVSGFIKQHHTNNKIISNCYSRVNLNVSDGSTKVAGLVSQVTGGQINNSYYSGVISGNPGGQSGALFGTGNGTSTGCFWDNELNSSIAAAGTTNTGYVMNGLGTSALKDISSFLLENWDFLGDTGNGTEDIWEIDMQNETNTYNDGYPFFNIQNGLFKT